MNEQVAEIYKLFELDTLNAFYQPIQGSTRVKFTCLDASSNFVFLGATSGSLYVFRRFPQLHYVKVLTSKEGPVTTISVSTNEKYVAVATSRGVVSIIHHSDIPTKPLHVSKGNLSCVTCLSWSLSGSSLYIGDDKGKVISINITLKKAHTIFQASTALIVQLQSPIVQLDVADNQLLISCHTGSHLCNIERENYSRIGSKLREGPFGSCFYQKKVIFCARPGSRLWEVDLKGKVLFTHQLKQALTKPSTSVISVNQHSLPTEQSALSQSVNFNRLHVICDKFIITWAGSQLYVFNPSTTIIELWCSLEYEIKNMKVTGSEIYIHFVNGKFKYLHLLHVDAGIEKLVHLQQWKLAANLCVLYKETIISSSKLHKHHLKNILVHLNGDANLHQHISNIVTSIDKLNPTVTSNGHAYKVESGIFVVSRPNGVTRTKPLNSATTSKRLDDTTLAKYQNDVVFDNVLAASHNMGIMTPFLASQFLDSDFAQFGYDAITSLAATVSFDDLKSKYYLGKDKILATMGQVEDRLKTNHQNTSQPLLDVRSPSKSRASIEEDIKNGNRSVVKKIKHSEVPKYLENFVEVSRDIWARILSVGHNHQELTSALHFWVQLLNEVHLVHQKICLSSETKSTSKMFRSSSLENLASSSKRERRKSLQQDFTTNSWTLEDYLWWQAQHITQLKLNVKFEWIYKQNSFRLRSEDALKVSQLASLCLSNDTYGQIAEFSKNFSNSNSDSENLARSLFIHLHFDLLNSRHIREELVKGSNQTLWTSFVKLLSASDRREDKVYFSPLLSCFNLVCSAKSKDVFQKISKEILSAPHLITPRDVLYFDQLANYNGRLLLVYMDETLERTFTRACGDSLVSHHWIRAILQNSTFPNFHVRCKCGTPKVGSHKFPWLRNDLLMQIIRASEVNDASMRLCKQYGFWLGYMYACNELKLRTETLSTLVSLGDKGLLDDCSNAALLPQSVEEWKLMLDMTNKWNDKCPTCQEDMIYESCPLLNIESLSEISLKFITPNICLQILSEMVPTVKLSSRFFRVATTKAFSVHKQRAESFSTTNHFIWSRFRSYATVDIRSKLLNEAFKFENFPTMERKDTLRNHWGRTVDLKSLCSKCSLPLIVPLTEQLPTVGGIRVFRCGHNFHLYCIREADKRCPLCQNY